MGSVVYNAGLISCSRRLSFQIVNCSGLRWKTLEQVDKELSKGNDRDALSLVNHLQGKPDGLRAFGAARQVFLLILIIYIFAANFVHYFHSPKKNSVEYGIGYVVANV